MTHRAALVGIVVEDTASIPKMNEILSDYSAYIVGRMGLPYRERGVDHQRRSRRTGQCDQFLSGKIGMLPEFLQRQSIQNIQRRGGKITMYDPKSMCADDFIDHQEILDTLSYAEQHKSDAVLIDSIIEKAKEKGFLTEKPPFS